MPALEYPLTNSQISELLAIAGDDAKRPLNRAYRRASRKSLLWEEEAACLYQEGRSLKELPCVGPYLEKIIRRRIEVSQVVPSPPSIRDNFFMLTQARSILRGKPLCPIRRWTWPIRATTWGLDRLSSRARRNCSKRRRRSATHRQATTIGSHWPCFATRRLGYSKGFSPELCRTGKPSDPPHPRDLLDSVGSSVKTTGIPVFSPHKSVCDPTGNAARLRRSTPPA